MVLLFTYMNCKIYHRGYFFNCCKYVIHVHVSFSIEVYKEKYLMGEKTDNVPVLWNVSFVFRWLSPTQ